MYCCIILFTMIQQYKFFNTLPPKTQNYVRVLPVKCHTLRKKSNKYLQINLEPVPRMIKINTLRADLLEYFHKINQLPLNFNIVSTDIIEILTIANRAYTSRAIGLGSGLYYKSDYSKHIRAVEDNMFLPPNPKYWESNTAYNIFAIKDNVLPSDAIRAWFNGPTIAECANTIQASIYLSILNTYGDDIFNKRFANPVSQFILTNNLFAPLVKESKKISNTGGTLGNPLFFLFKLIPENTKLENIQHGDIVYIGGVKNYKTKHLDGESGGWNLICIKETDKPLKFLGFGPDGFSKGALTFEELRKLFIDNYNKEQTDIEKARIEKFTQSSYTGDHRALSEAARKLAFDTVEFDTDIIGLTVKLRLNKEVLDGFMLNDNKPWGAIDLEAVRTDAKLVNIIPFSAENKHKTFDNYKADTIERKEILDIARKFALHVSSKEPTFPSGCILTGTAGIGKTHLAVSIAKYVSKYKRVLYVDSAYFSRDYQAQMSKIVDAGKMLDDTMLDAGKMLDDTMLNDIDLIILDDINSCYGPSSAFLESAIKKIYENNLSILITSNKPIERLYEYIPYYIDIFEPFSNNFIVKNYNMVSFRTPWSDNCVKTKIDETFLKWDGPAGIIIKDVQPHIFKNDTLESINNTNNLVQTKLLEYAEQYAQQYKLASPIKIIGPAYKYTQQNGYLHYKIEDKYSTGLEKASYAIMYISEHYGGSCYKLIDIISIIHDNAVKIIIITDNVQFVKTELKKIITGIGNDKQRITDRVRIILPGV